MYWWGGGGSRHDQKAVLVDLRYWALLAKRVLSCSLLLLLHTCEICIMISNYAAEPTDGHGRCSARVLRISNSQAT